MNKFIFHKKLIVIFILGFFSNCTNERRKSCSNLNTKLIDSIDVRTGSNIRGFVICGDREGFWHYLKDGTINLAEFYKNDSLVCQERFFNGNVYARDFYSSGSLEKAVLVNTESYIEMQNLNICERFDFSPSKDIGKKIFLNNCRGCHFIRNGHEFLDDYRINDFEEFSNVLKSFKNPMLLKAEEVLIYERNNDTSNVHFSSNFLSRSDIISLWLFLSSDDYLMEFP